jgi:hypothetical protein
LSGSSATSFAEAQVDTSTGPVTLVRPPGAQSVSAPHGTTPPVPLGHDEPVWT